MNITTAVFALTDYALKKGLIQSCDETYILNSLAYAAGLDSLPPREHFDYPLQEILQSFDDHAAEAGLIEQNTVSRRELYDTMIMGIVTPMPHEVVAKFQSLPSEQATDYFYNLAIDTNYIRMDAVKRNVYWTTPTEYGDIEITVNLSKPEKDPRDIAAAGKAKASGYPKCLLCRENEGFAGTISHPARQNIRLIPLKLSGEDWFLQYSPYVYYNEHCIVLNSQHVPMQVSRRSFERLADFVTRFPHYFIGSNADLPIVGGSILSHDHFQGGRHTFAMANASPAVALSLDPKGIVSSCIVKWPMSVIRLRSADKDRLIDLATAVLDAWRSYTDTEANVIAQDEQGLHNTITPIFRRRGDDYECDLVLRNNRTSDEYPMGIYHPHAAKHHIKKENIGLIEVMGLAILPARLKTELAAVRDGLLSGRDLYADEATKSHADWAYECVAKRADFNSETADEIIRQEVGRVFAEVLADAGVYKQDKAGIEAFVRFTDSVRFE